MRFVGQVLAGMVLLAFLAGCETTHTQINQTPNTAADFAKTVAVLPFTFDTTLPAEHRPHAVLRNVFFNYFSYLGYTDIALEEVDRRLEKSGVKTADLTAAANREALRQALDADAVIRGYVENANNITTGIYSETRIKAKLEMIDLRTGQTLWQIEHQEMDVSGVLAFTLYDVIQSQIDNAQVDEAFARVAESFTLSVIDAIPDPAETRKASVRLPQITAIRAELPADGKIKPNDVVQVELTGDAGLTASFDINSRKTGLPMHEQTPGHYAGSYRITSADGILHAGIVGHLKNKDGLSGRKFYNASATTGGANKRAG